jgi:hypothetical protein
MERLTDDLFKPLAQTESKRLVGGVEPREPQIFPRSGCIVPDTEPWQPTPY